MHTQWTDQLSAYLDGELPPEARGSLEAHLVPSERSLEAFETVKASARRMLEQRFSIGHATLEACLDVHGGDHEPTSRAHPK